MMIASTMIIWTLMIMIVVGMNVTDGMSRIMIANATELT